MSAADNFGLYFIASACAAYIAAILVVVAATYVLGLRAEHVKWHTDKGKK